MRDETLATLKQAVEFETQRNEGPPEGFPALAEIPGGRYSTQTFFDLETAAMWNQSWVCVGLESSLLNPGDYQSFDKLSSPTLIVRGKDKKLRAFYNTCRHRGARLTKEQSGCTKLLRCQYHSWAYDLTGKLISVPNEQDFACLDKSERGLIELRCEVWNGLVFITENDKATGIVESLGEIVSDFESIDINSLRAVQHSSIHLNCNWKAGVDAFLESYHVKTVHPQTVSQMLNVDGTVMTLLDNGHSRMVIPRKLGDKKGEKNANFTAHNAAPDITEMHRTFGQNSIVYHLFPNTLIPLDTRVFQFFDFGLAVKTNVSLK
jgi:phenylpropionate dioxygenase-like ring-hydroxylating dioxygenase large terminal subunit